MNTTEKHELDLLVRRLAPVEDDTLRLAFGDDAEAFARDVMGTHPDVELADVGTSAVPSRPRRHRLIPAMAAVAIVVFAVATVTFLPLGTSQPAIAGWGPEPSEPTPELLDAAATECPPPLDAEPGEQLFSFMASAPPIVAADLRGNAASAVFADETQYYVCILVEVDGSWEFSSGLPGASSGASAPIDADRAHHWTYGEMNLTTVVGHIDHTVDRVTIQLEDGTELEATAGGGIFLAWWPSTVPFANASAYDANGVEVGTDDSVFTSGMVTEF